MQELEPTALEQLERFERLLPWEQISEEDFFWVNGFYISIRGNTRKPTGAYFCPNQKIAETLVFKPKAHVPAGVWVAIKSWEITARYLQPNTMSR